MHCALGRRRRHLQRRSCNKFIAPALLAWQAHDGAVGVDASFFDAIAVLIADDSVVARRVMTNVLSADPDIRVVGTAGSGRIALEKIEEENADELTPERIAALEVELAVHRRAAELLKEAVPPKGPVRGHPAGGR